jgi:hypothetical protein
MDNRFPLQALWFTGLIISLFMLAWFVAGGSTGEAAVQEANSTKTALAMTASYLLQPRSQTPPPFTPTALPPTLIPRSASTLAALLSATSPSSPGQFNTPISPVAPSSTPLPTESAVAQIPTFTATDSPHRENTKAPALAQQSATPTMIIQVLPASETPAVLQNPAEFASWYFTRVWNERDYQNLWDNYLTASYKANVGSGIFEDYVFWWDSVQWVEIVSVKVLENNGTDAWVQVHLNFHMKDGRVVQDQVYDYDFLYDPSRNTWMFDASV